LDVHKKYTEVAVLGDDGVILRQDRIENDPERIESLSEGISNASIVMESSSSWYWLYRILSKRHRVVLSNPVKTRAIASAKVKTDRIDALMLADLLRGGFIPECYIPSPRMMELKELVRYRANLVRIRSGVKNRIHAYLLMNNIRLEGMPFTVQFMDDLEGIDDPKVRGYLRIIRQLNEEIREASRLISHEALSDENARLLMTIPGISYYSALLIVSEIGDITRFPSSALLREPGLVCRPRPIYPFIGRRDLPREDNQDRLLLPEVGPQPVRPLAHEGRARWHCGEVLQTALPGEGAYQGNNGRIREAAEDSVCSPQGGASVSQLRGISCAFFMRS